MPKVTVYSTQNCPYCRMVKAFLERQGVDYLPVDVGTDKEQAKKMIELSGQYGVPVVTVDDEVIVGYDAQRLNELFGEEKGGVVFDVLIIGAGPAGLTAGVYCARKLLKTLIVSENIGGQASESWAIENYMGYRMITGDDLMRKFEEQVRSLDLHLEIDKVLILDRSGNEFIVNTATGAAYRARAVILTQGKQPRKLGVEGEERYLGRGLSVCSTCDGPLFRDKVVAVVGGGNSALQTAIEMSGIAREVHLIVRSTIKADEVYVRAFEKKSNIITHMNSVVSRLQGNSMLSGITLKDRASGKETDLLVNGLFAEIGWIPNTAFLEGIVDMNPDMEVVIDINCHTSVPGIFAAGDITNIRTKQIITAAGEGAKAALSAYEYLMK
ncbi:MAG TPA: FAD-dependent oxidoreductase [Methanoregulaceae archaeon]|nr:FAD-dependent oxidoreductase [Methanoregulaceae archaeon]HOB59038.1 FAD-dependent oxidoreductase [Methanoregulaceae archaeon]HOH80057.1 FAD-dependent oxidoreductase [Methanoregulaceae archaeon]HOW33318.1 FAD-dependent oxidoreductase [Methanoregulaceae archaeon]HPW10624.1 FAD-dependent oxidoreductase [Methanoregulaceae archaeon]